MRFLVLLFAIAMPIVAWFSNNDAFGPDNGTISDRYPTLLVAAGYAFSIWGLIFLLDAAFALWQLRERGAAVVRARLPAAIGFALTAAWMPVFSQQWFGLALAIIWASLAAMLWAAWLLSRESTLGRGERWLAWLPLSLHAGWLSLAAFLNTAQVIVAFELFDTLHMLEWSAILFGLAGVLLLAANRAMRGNLAYAAAALWGLAAVYVKQSNWTLDGADTTAWFALALAALLALQTGWLYWRGRQATS
jgi:hypothetical protein